MTTCACTARSDRGNGRRGEGKIRKEEKKTRQLGFQRRDNFKEETALPFVGLSFFLYVFHSRFSMFIHIFIIIYYCLLLLIIIYYYFILVFRLYVNYAL